MFAAGAAVAGAPAAGLAALLDAERGADHDPMLLVDASVFLTELGHPADALAFLDEARKLGSVNAAPLGLSDTAAELDDRGFALLGLHRYAAALKALQGAVGRRAPAVRGEHQRGAGARLHRPTRSGLPRAGRRRLPPVL